MKKALILLGIAIGCIILVILLDRNASNLSDDQKNKALTQILGRKPNLSSSNSNVGDIMFKGKYVSFLYPANAKIYTQTLNGTPLPRTELENFSFDIKDPRIIFLMSVENMPQSVASVSDYPGVKLRENQSNLYKKNNITSDSLKGVSFEKKDTTGIEKTAFFYKSNNIYTFSVQGSSLEEIDRVYKKVLLSVKFLQ